MSYPRTDNATGKTRSKAAANPGGHNRDTRMPPGPDTSRTRSATSRNPGGKGGSTPPESTATGRTSNRTGGQPSPTHVQSGPKITRISPP